MGSSGTGLTSMVMVTSPLGGLILRGGLAKHPPLGLVFFHRDWSTFFTLLLLEIPFLIFSSHRPDLPLAVGSEIFCKVLLLCLSRLVLLSGLALLAPVY
jgi:hypothetical protein